LNVTDNYFAIGFDARYFYFLLEVYMSGKVSSFQYQWLSEFRKGRRVAEDLNLKIDLLRLTRWRKRL